jgi:hypothetical protein
MKCKNCFIFIIMAVASLQELEAQDKTNYKFGKISVADFELAGMKFDSGANAVIIEDIGSTRFEGNNQDFFTLVFTRYMRVKIMNKNGFDIGKYQLFLYHDKDDFEKLYSVRGSTFNMENGLITETKLDDKSIFSEKYNKRHDIKKFSMPALKEGAIYDLEYVIKSPFYGQLRSWTFQGVYPCLWSEYVVTIPPPFHYVMSIQGDQHFNINTTKEVFGSFTIKHENRVSQSEDYIFTGSSVEKRWVKKDIPALHKEPFMTTLENYYSKVTFQLNYFQWVTTYGASEKHDYLTTWSSTSKTLLEDENFGLTLNYENSWMKDELKNLDQGASSYEDKIYRIYDFVRENFRATNKEGYSKNGIWALSSLKEVYKKREGNVAELNLLLTAMLRQENIKADPLILSTKDHGIANATYPLIDDYNYVICIAFLGDKTITLDASQPYNGYGQLPVECYNGWGHIMNQEKPLPILLVSDSIFETSVTSVFITNDEKGQPSGNLKSVFGKAGSYDRRNEIINSSEREFEKKIQASKGSDLVIENFGIDSLKKYNLPLSIRYEFEFKNLLAGDIIHFNPMMDEGYTSNPFKSMERHFPVEIPYKIDNTYLLSMEIPAGYQVDELPKSVKVAYNENEGSFEYLIQKNEHNIQMRVRLKLNKAFFPTEEYSNLRDFFAFIVKKENEQIFFKKIK